MFDNHYFPVRKKDLRTADVKQRGIVIDRKEGNKKKIYSGGKKEAKDLSWQGSGDRRGIIQRIVTEVD